MTNNVKQEEALELWEALFGKSTNASGNAEGYVTYQRFIQVIQALGTHSTEYGKWDGAQADSREQVKYEEAQLNKSKGE